MTNLYRLQTLLVMLLFSMNPSWTYGQFGDPITVNLLNTGSIYSDQFVACTSYTFEVLENTQPNLGSASVALGSFPNTVKLTFLPDAGAIGTTDVFVKYYTMTTPMHPVTRWYRFNISNVLVTAAPDKYLVDVGAVDAPLHVLDNDTVTNGQLFLSTVSVLNGGNAVVNASGNAILFTPEDDFDGDTWIQYIACDSTGNCGEGNVHVLVRDPNAQDSIIYTKFVLNTRTLEVLTPFEDFEVDLAPLHGNLSISDSTSWVYMPDADYTGKDTFRLSLLNLVYREYEVNVYEKPVNVHARNDKFYVRPSLSVTFNVLNNDLLDYEVSSYTDPAKGVLLDLGDGEYTYTPNIGYKGVDKFTYTTCFQDTVYCETATVYLHVTDLEPDNQFSYELQTSEDLPLVIDYPIDFTDFSYIISDEPDHGELVFYDGLQVINLPCDTIEGYNMLVYKPEAGYTGPDTFEYYYCVIPTNLCYLVKVDMNVVEEPEAETCPCVVGCVWPGDGNKDGRVDMADLLTLGHHLGDTGPDRDYNDPETWFGQHAGSWTEGVDVDIQHLDSDGNGSLTADDVDNISSYYYQTHDVVAKDVQQKLPYQFTIIPIQYSLDSGDLVILDIALGNANNPVLDLKGVKFSINIPDYMMDSASVEVDFHQDSWLAEGAPFISLGMVPWDGRIDAGLARAQGIGAPGHGVIATVVFIIEDDLEGFKTGNGIIQIPIRLEEGTGMDGNGTMYDMEGAEFILTYDLNSTKPNPYELIIYPNPANEVVNIHLNGKTIIETIDVIDPQGRLMQSFDNIDQKHFQFDAATLDTGLYYLNVKHSNGTLTKLLSVIK